MAVYNEILVGRINHYLQKLFGIKGPPPVPQLSSEVMAIHPLQSGIENRFTEGWNEFGLFQSQPALAAATSAVQLRNPSGSNVIAAVSRLSIFESVADAGTTISNAAVVDLATTQNGVSLDKRYWNTGNVPNKSNLSPSRANTVAAGGFLLAGIAVGANTSVDVIPHEEAEFVLLPGDGLLIVSGAVNVTLNVTWRWRERFLEDSERS